MEDRRDVLDKRYRTLHDMRGVGREWFLPKGSISTGNIDIEDEQNTWIDFPVGVWFEQHEMDRKTSDFEVLTEEIVQRTCYRAPGGGVGG